MKYYQILTYSNWPTQVQDEWIAIYSLSSRSWMRLKWDHGGVSWEVVAGSLIVMAIVSKVVFAQLHGAWTTEVWWTMFVQWPCSTLVVVSLWVPRYMVASTCVMIQFGVEKFLGGEVAVMFLSVMKH